MVLLRWSEEPDIQVQFLGVAHLYLTGVNGSMTVSKTVGRGSSPRWGANFNGVCSSEVERWFVTPEVGISKFLTHPKQCGCSSEAEQVVANDQVEISKFSIRSKL
jgi:hypothetical protein